MQRLVCSLLILLVVIGGSAQAEPFVEGRALWVPAWEMTSPAGVRQMVALAEEYNFNSLFVQVRYRGDALYQPNHRNTSHYNPEPRSRFLRNQSADFDPLALSIELAHGAGMSLHAWVTCFEITGGYAPGDETHVVNRHREWVSYSNRSYMMPLGSRAWLDPGISAVRNYTKEVFLDLVANYNVDGLHLDYVRYHGPEMGFNPLALAEYRYETGLAPADNSANWADWRRAKITDFVRQVSAEAKRVHPGLILSAAVFAGRTGTAYNDVSQDWGRWLDEGLIDLLAPMAYSTNDTTLARQLADAVYVAGEIPVYAGLTLVDFSDNDRPLSVYEVNRHSHLARLHGAAGVAFFSYTALRDMIAAGLTPEQLFSGKRSEPIFEASK